MELQNSQKSKKIFVSLYFIAAMIYLFIGFLPAEAYGQYTMLNIPSINFESKVAELNLDNHGLKTPDLIVGSFSNNKNKTLLIGHASTVFNNLKNVFVGDTIIYDNKIYSIKSYIIMPKKDINMNALLKSEQIDTLVLMTCAGIIYDNGDASHRIIIEASLSE